MKQIKRMAAFVAVLLFVACAPIKRHDRIVKKYPFVHTMDSVTIIDTVRVLIPESKVDTSFYEALLYDTVYIYDTENRLEIKLWKDPKQPEKVFVQGKAKEVFIEKIIERRVPVTVFKERNSWLKNFFVWGVVIFILLSIYNHYKKNKADGNCNHSDTTTN